MNSHRRAVLAAVAAAGAAIAQSLTPGSARAQTPAPSGGPADGPSNDHTAFQLSPNADPFELFTEWLAEAKRAGEPLPIAMTLATVGIDGSPDARMMLHQGVQDGAFLFTTFANSSKGKELRSNPKAALVFYWNANGRQVRVRGDVRHLAGPDLDFAWRQKRPSRPLKLRDLAWRQSDVFDTAETLEARLAQTDANYPQDVPRGDWTGYLLTPRSIEFFLPHPRTLLHERLIFKRTGKTMAWRTERLVP